MVKLVEEIGKQTSLPTSKSPACSQQLQGWKKSLITQFRALLFDFCRRYKLQPSDVKVGSSLSQHMFRHAVWLLNMLQLHLSDNKTSFQRRWSIAYSSSVLPFGELVLIQDHRLQPQSSLAIWLGRCEATNEHILATANSSSLIKTRIVTKLSSESSMDITLFKSISLPPPELASTASLKKVSCGVQLLAEAGGEEELRSESSPQAYIKHPQQKAERRHSEQPRALSVSF